jgi:signal transduction histidine kinase
VLDLSKIEAGKLKLAPESVTLAPLIEEVIGTARQLAEQNNNRLTVEAAAAGTRDKALAAGCDEFDTKPIEFDRLIAIIRRLLDRRESVRS